MPTKTSKTWRTETYSYTYETPAGKTQTTTRYPVEQLDNTVTSAGPLKDYQYRIANGLNATTSLSGTLWTSTPKPLSGLEWGRDVYNVQGVRTTYEHFRMSGQLCRVSSAGMLIGVGTVNYSSADNQAKSSFLQDLASVRDSFKGMVFAGELAESLHMIRHPAQALRNGLSSYLQRLKRGAAGKGRSARPKFVRDTWLEYSFGWRPLINDIDSAIDAFYRSRLPRPIFKMVHGSGVSRTRTNSTAIDLDMGTHFAHWDVLDDLEAHVKYYGVYHSTGNGVSNVHSFGFSPHEFIPTLWELIPYSFLVDYFTNIGDIISSWSYRNIGCSWASKGTLGLYRREAINPKMNPKPAYLATGNKLYARGGLGSSRLDLRAVQRYPSVSIELPSLELQVPGMSSVKWLNLAALTTQLDGTRRSLRGP